ncbi:MAG: hypothetical protein JST54_00025 [Deltaproteobacteria bacterium]|nr:hypothetical protein [Deltaproteobacteria bacterium]
MIPRHHTAATLVSVAMFLGAAGCSSSPSPSFDPNDTGAAAGATSGGPTGGGQGSTGATGTTGASASASTTSTTSGSSTSTSTTGAAGSSGSSGSTGCSATHDNLAQLSFGSDTLNVAQAGGDCTTDPNHPFGAGGQGAPCTTADDCAQTCCPCTSSSNAFAASACVSGACVGVSCSYAESHDSCLCQ